MLFFDLITNKKCDRVVFQIYMWPEQRHPLLGALYLQLVVFACIRKH